jgi:N-acetylmuramoyl-L-alanine amidase
MYNNNKKRTETLYMIIDHSGTTPTIDIDATNQDNRDRSKGFYGCRYHYVINRQGVVEEGRTLNRVSPLTGVLDYQSMTVCLVGGKNIEGEAEDNFTDAQKDALRELITVSRKSYPDLQILGRKEVRKQRTTGPALDLTSYR